MEKLFEKLLELLNGLPVTAIFISILAGIVRTNMTGKTKSLTEYLSSILTAVFVGHVTGGILADYNISPGHAGALIALASAISIDIMAVVFCVGRRVQENPRLVIDFLLKLTK